MYEYIKDGMIINNKQKYIIIKLIIKHLAIFRSNMITTFFNDGL